MAYTTFIPIVTDGLVFSVDAYNRKSYVSGDTITYDLTINGNNGTLFNGVGFGGTSFSFDGINDYINIDNVLSQVSSDTQGTISAWAKLNDATPSSLQEIVSFNDASSNERIEIAFEVTTGQFRGYCNNAGGQRWFILTDTVATSDNTWVNVSLTQNGSSVTLYVNGVAVPQSTSGPQNGPGDWFNTQSQLDNARIGCRNINSGGNTRFLSGNISSVKIYNRALTSDEILQNYNATKWRFQ